MAGRKQNTQKTLLLFVQYSHLISLLKYDILNAEIEGIKIINEYSYDKMFIMFRDPGGANKFTVYKCSV